MKMASKIKTTQRAIERTMINITRRDRWRNTDLRKKTKVMDIIHRAKQDTLAGERTEDGQGV